MTIRRLEPKPLPERIRTAVERVSTHLREHPTLDPRETKQVISELREDEKLDLRKTELVLTAGLAAHHFEGLDGARDRVAAHLAEALGKTPEDLHAAVREHLGELATVPAVSESELDAALAPVEQRKTVPSKEAGRTEHPFGELRDMDPAEYKRVLAHLAEDMRERLANGELDESLVQYFMRRVRELTNVNVLRADTLASMLRDFGPALRALFEREMPIAVIGSTEGHQPQAVRDFMKAVYDELGERGLRERVAHVGRLNATGVQGAAYAALERVKEVDTIGLSAAAKETLTRPIAAVRKPGLFGTQLGDETWLTLELAKRGVALVFGDDPATVREAKDLVDRNPHHTIIIGGPGGSMPEALKGKERVTYIPEGTTSPVEAGRRVGALIAERIATEQRDLLNDPLVKLAFSASPGQMADMVNHLQQNAAKNRITRIITAVANRLETKGVEKGRIWIEVSSLAQELARHTMGVDNLQDNALWQKRAKEAFQATGGEVAKLAEDATADVYFASWLGIQRKPQKPSFFEENVGALPEEARRSKFDYGAPHTMLDLNKYAYVRLDKPIADMLRVAAETPNSRPEVFLGSEDELNAYYTSKGFSVSYNTFDSNGTQYLVLQRGDVSLPVIHGIDSPARLTQVTALMEHAGIDTSKIITRGDLNKVRANAQNALQLALANMHRPIAGVVVNNANESLATLAARAGIKAEDIRSRVTSHTVGPFRFEAIEVKAAGQSEPQLLLAFKPAYGELTQDLVNATLSVGARNFFIGGAGGSLIQEPGQLGTMHRVTQIDYKGRVVDLERAGLELMKPTAAVTRDRVTNVFHPSPMLQDRAWADGVRAQHPAADVDQESAAALFALAEARRERPTDQLNRGEVLVHEPIFVSTLLHQSDVVGEGHLELGTVDSKYSPNVTEALGKWMDELGLGEVKNSEGEFVKVRGAQAGRLARQKPALDVSGVQVPIADMGSIGASTEYSHVDQLKGEKRILMVESKNATWKDKERLGTLLSRLNKSDHWVVVDQRDPMHGELLKIAKDRGFETVLLTTKEASQKDQILGTPSFTMFFDKPEEISAAKNELLTQGTRYEWEENDAEHSFIGVGDFQLKHTPGQHEFFTSRLASTREAQQAGDSIRAEVDDKRAMVEEGIHAWFDGTYTTRPGESLFELAVRFGLVDLHSGLESAVLPSVKSVLGAAVSLRATLGGPAAVDTGPLDGKSAKALATELAEDPRPKVRRLGSIALAALNAKTKWPDNIPGPAKVAAIQAACKEIDQDIWHARSGQDAGVVSALDSLHESLKRVIEQGLRSPLNDLNPSVANATPLPEGTAVRLRDGQPMKGPEIIDFASFGDVIGDRKLLYITGASVKSWPMASEAQREQWVRDVQLLSLLLDPKKVSMVSGGVTKLGLEAYAQDAFGERGFQVIGPAPENTLKDLQQVSPRLTHVLISGINWFGKSRPVLKLIEDHNGDVLVFGGGPILHAEVKTAVGMGARTHLAASTDRYSPEGAAQKQRLEQAGKPVQLVASAELADEYKALAFHTAQDLFTRLGIDTSQLTIDMVNGEVSAQALEKIRRELDKRAA